MNDWLEYGLPNISLRFNQRNKCPNFMISVKVLTAYSYQIIKIYPRKLCGQHLFTLFQTLKRISMKSKNALNSFFFCKGRERNRWLCSHPISISYTFYFWQLPLSLTEFQYWNFPERIRFQNFLGRRRQNKFSVFLCENK